MKTKEMAIVFEAYGHSVRSLRDGYYVFTEGPTVAESIDAFHPDCDGLSIAIAYCKYLGKRLREKEALGYIVPELESKTGGKDAPF